MELQPPALLLLLLLAVFVAALQPVAPATQAPVPAGCSNLTGNWCEQTTGLRQIFTGLNLA